MSTRRKRTNQMADSNKRKRPIYADTLTIRIGENSQPFIVHRDTVCRNSDYFEKLCRKDTAGKKLAGTTVEAGDGGVDLFDLYVDMLYHPEADLYDTITTSKQHAASKNLQATSDQTTEVVLMMFQLWVLCDSLQDYKAQNAVMDAIVALPVQAICSSGPIIWVSTHTTAATSPLARWLVDALAPQLDSSTQMITLLNELKGQLTADMWELLLRAKVLPKFDAGPASKCRLHVHPTDADKCK
ncbi:hypothetical protein LTR17_017972 [Elasticomyces elasticus]|nr:hypothetical protein LTR17_017972 [Elasticomyces elasticus]